MSTEILTSGCSFKCQPKIAPLQTSTPKTDQNFSDVGIFAELRISKKTDFLAKMAIWIKSVQYFWKNRGPKIVPTFRHHQTHAAAAANSCC